MEKASNMFVSTRRIRLSVGIIDWNGNECSPNGAIRGMRFAYLEGLDGNVLELGDIPEKVRLRRQDDIASAACWDGSDPVRIFN